MAFRLTFALRVRQAAPKSGAIPSSAGSIGNFGQTFRTVSAAVGFEVARILAWTVPALPQPNLRCREQLLAPRRRDGSHSLQGSPLAAASWTPLWMWIP